MLVSLWGAQIYLPETNRNIESSYKSVNSLLKELIKVNILFWGKECSDSKIYRHRGFPCRQLMHCHTSCQSLTWAPIPMRPSLRHSIAYLYPCPTWPRTQLSGTYGNVQTYKKYMLVKVLLCSKFWLPFSFQLWKVEVINTYLAKFQVKIPMGRHYFKHKVQICFGAITQFKKWPRTTKRSRTCRNKRNVKSYAHHGSLLWPRETASHFILI